jgi:hypothetical protein
MIYVAYYADGNDTEAHQPPEWDLERVIINAWNDNVDGLNPLGPPPIRVEVYEDDGTTLLYAEDKNFSVTAVEITK